MGGKIRVSEQRSSFGFVSFFALFIQLLWATVRVVSRTHPSSQALTNIEGIIAKSQALMVARGDLGVELELERVPFAQKLLIRREVGMGS